MDFSHPVAGPGLTQAPAVASLDDLFGAELRDTPLGPPESWPPAIRTLLRTALASPLPMWVGWGPDLAGLGNAACRRIAGRPPAPGRPAEEAWRGLGDVVPLLRAAFAGEGRAEPRRIGPEPEGISALVAAAPVLDEAGGICGVVCTLIPHCPEPGFAPSQDSLLPEAAARRLLLAEMSEAIRGLDSPDAIAVTAAGRLGPHLGAVRCGWAWVDASGDTVTVAEDWTGGVPSVAGLQRLGALGQEIVAALRRGEAAVVPDAQAGPERAQGFGGCAPRAHVTVPVLRDRHLTALLFVHADVPRAWSPAEVELLREAAGRVAAAMDAARTLSDLRGNQAFTRDILETSADCIKVLDLDGRLRFMSAGGQRVMEVDDPCQLYGRYWPDIWPPEARSLAEAAVARARAGGVGRFRGPAATAKGNLRFWDVVVSPILDGDGRPARLLSISRDITAQRQAEDALRDSEARFRTMADSAPVMVWTSDAQGQCTYVNRMWREFTGRPRSEALGRSFLLAIHPDDLTRTEPVVAAARAARRPFRLEYRLRRADGSYAWVIDTASPRLSSSGAYLGDVGSILDITERKRSEEVRALLVNELNHRVKNTLATVQSLARQSFRLGQVDQAVRDAFETRLLALARAHDVLTRESWEGAPLGDIARRAMEPFGEEGERVLLAGPELWLPPHMALAFGMALHELAANAARYGALSVPQGRVELRWEAAGQRRGRRLRLTWAERNGPPVQPPVRQGFGSRLVRHGLAAELGGEVDIDYSPTGLMCRVDAPLPTEDAG